VDKSGDDLHNPLLEILFFGISAPKVGDSRFRNPATRRRGTGIGKMPLDCVGCEPHRDQSRQVPEVVRSAKAFIDATPDAH
jgi:hypothetical protein